MRRIDWRRGFRRDGYVVFPGLCPLELVATARSAIDRDLAANYDASRQLEYDNRSYCPALLGTGPIMALLLESGALAKLDKVIASNRLVHDHGQIALRRAGNADTAQPPVPHIDGLPTPLNGVPSDILVSIFTALVGVFLSPASQDFAGNFTVWPGSHQLLAAHFRAVGPAALRDGMPQIPLGEPRQLLTGIGDVVLCHYELAHCAAVNLSAQARYAVYFRLRLNDIDDDNRWEFISNPWKGWRC